MEGSIQQKGENETNSTNRKLDKIDQEKKSNEIKNKLQQNQERETDEKRNKRKVKQM